MRSRRACQTGLCLAVTAKLAQVRHVLSVLSTGIRATLVAKAGSRLDAVDAIAPVADPKAEVGLFHQESDIGLDISVARAPAELRVSGDHASTLAGERRRRQHLFQGSAGFFPSMPVDQVVEREVGSDIAAIGHGAGHMPKWA